MTVCASELRGEHYRSGAWIDRYGWIWEWDANHDKWRGHGSNGRQAFATDDELSNYNLMGGRGTFYRLATGNEPTLPSITVDELADVVGEASYLMGWDNLTWGDGQEEITASQREFAEYLLRFLAVRKLEHTTMEIKERDRE